MTPQDKRIDAALEANRVRIDRELAEERALSKVPDDHVTPGSNVDHCYRPLDSCACRRCRGTLRPAGQPPSHWQKGSIVITLGGFLAGVVDGRVVCEASWPFTILIACVVAWCVARTAVAPPHFRDARRWLGGLAGPARDRKALPGPSYELGAPVGHLVAFGTRKVYDRK